MPLVRSGRWILVVSNRDDVKKDSSGFDDKAIDYEACIYHDNDMNTHAAPHKTRIIIIP